MNKKPYYEIGKTYIYPHTGEHCVLIATTTNEKCHDDGQETCAICKGKMKFKTSRGKEIITCPYTYNEVSRDWVPYLLKIGEEPLLSYHGDKK